MTLFDLTHPVREEMPVYPGDPPVAVRPHATHADDGYAVTALELGSHSGTHVDAPAHTEPDGATLGAFDVADFRLDARRVDLRDLGPREAIERDRLPETDADCLVCWTGWAEHWGSDRYRDHPYLAPDAATWCADRGLAVGVDTFGPDPTPTEEAGSDEPTGVPAHHALLGAGCLLVENLRNLGASPERFTLHVYPLALDADAAPARAVAEA